MRKAMISRILVVLWLLGASLQAEIRFGLIPWSGPEVMLENFTPTAKLLEEQLGEKVTLRVAKDYQNLLDQLKDNALDLALLNGNLFAKEYQGGKGFTYIATVKTLINGKPSSHYNSLILAHKDSGLKSLADLKGKTFAFTDKNSGSGFVIPSLTLSEQGIVPESYFSQLFYLKKHPKVYAAIAAKSVDAGACSNELWEESQKAHGAVFTIIATSPDLPLDAIVAHSAMEPSKVAAIQKLLQDAHTHAAFAAAKSEIKGYAVRDVKFYDTYRKARENLGL